jgi:hypothetical protein
VRAGDSGVTNGVRTPGKVPIPCRPVGRRQDPRGRSAPPAGQLVSCARGRPKVKPHQQHELTRGQRPVTAPLQVAQAIKPFDRVARLDPPICVLDVRVAAPCSEMGLGIRRSPLRG